MHAQRKPGLLLIAGFCLLVFVLAGSPAAFAAASRPHEFSKAFGEACPGEPCTGAELKSPDGVAISEATGDVFVVDKGANRLVRFNEEGVFQSEVTGPSATGSGTLAEGSSTIESALATSGVFSPGEEVTAAGLPPETTITAVLPGGVLEVSNPVEAGKSGVAVPLSAHQDFESPETIAVDNTCALRKLKEPGLTLTQQEECEAGDPSNGDVYVVDAGLEHPFEHTVVDKFTPTGEYLGQISEGKETEGAPLERFFRALDGVAVGSEGSVWIYQENRVVGKYSNAVANKFLSVTQLNGFVDLGRPGFAIDSKGNFYVRHGSPGEPEDNRIAKVDPTGTILNRELDSELSTAVAVDLTSDDPAICNTATVAIFDPEGALLERLGEEEGLHHLSNCAGIGVSATAGSLYVSDAATGTVAVFGPAQAATPKVESESFSEVTSTSARLAATINPRSEPGEAITEYHFQYGRCASIDPESCSESGYEADVPVPDGQIPADFSVHAVGAEATGLQPGSTYHFRAIATNSHGQGAPGKDTTFTTEGAGGELALADNRGWELVSPPDKQGTRIEAISETGVIQAAASGDAITYLTNAPTEADPQGYANRAQVLSRRSAAAWSSRDIAIPHTGPTGSGGGPEETLFDPELTLSALQPFGPFIPQLSDQASESTAYLHDLGDSCGSSCFQPLVTGKRGFANVAEGTRFGEEERCTPSGNGSAIEGICGPRVLGASEDLGHIVLRSRAELVPGTSHGLYEWNAGALSPVSVLPGGEPVAEGVESSLGLKDLAARRAISSDGSRVVWGAAGNLYLRDTSRGETLQLDAAACGGCESGGGRFQIASSDGSRIFFTDQKQLSEGSGANPEKEADLYECKVPPGKLACELSDLTPPHGEEGANVQGGVLGASEDGSYVYFVAKGVLSEAANSRGQHAIAKEANLYLSHDGARSFIATLSGGDEHDWEEAPARQPTRVSKDGRFLELMSQASLTGYDNRDLATRHPVAEVYLYDATTGRLSCASCNPSATRPTGIEYLKLEPGSGGLVGGPRGIWPASALVGANVPGWTAIDTSPFSRYQPRYLADSGRLFFNTAAALVPQDSNGTQDVYQYEPPGVGSCSESDPTFSARSGGCVSLISSGRSTQESAFLDASESGDDVFFLTSAKLSPLDVDPSADVYDAHVCTDASPCITFPDVQSPPCTTEASCKASPTPQPQIFGAPASATFSGPPNPAPPAPPKPKVKTAAQIRAEKLAKALKACHAKKSKQKRKACEKQARKRYGPVKAKKAKGKAKKKGKK